jgi:hypothetical protein
MDEIQIDDLVYKEKEVKKQTKMKMRHSDLFYKLRKELQCPKDWNPSQRVKQVIKQLERDVVPDSDEEGYSYITMESASDYSITDEEESEVKNETNKIIKMCAPIIP